MRRALLPLCALLLAAPLAAEDGDLPAERLRPAIDREGINDVESASIAPHLAYDLALWLGWAVNPVSLDDASGRAANLVGLRTGASLVAAVGLFDIGQLGVELPLVVGQDRDLGGTEVLGSTALEPRLTAFGLGDLRVVPKISLLRRETQLVDLAILTSFTLPTGFPENRYMGEPRSGGFGGVTLNPEIAFGGVVGEHLRYGLNLGYRLRGEHRVGPLVVGPEVFYAAGLGVRLHDLASIPVELDLSASGHVGTVAETPAGLEATLGATWDLGDRLQLLAGVGLGLVRDVRVPDGRFVLAARYAPRVFDKDEDGVTDADDQCPETPEDADGFQDGDGCPEPDNDGDGVLDIDDRCREAAEDPDGFEDEDGCPDADNDGDQIVDREDRCPDEAEDPDGFQDEDGCPELDNDGDEIPDAEDRCPLEPGAGDGCPLVVHNLSGDFHELLTAVEAAPDATARRAAWDAFQQKHAALYEGFILKGIEPAERDRRINAFLAALPGLAEKSRALFTAIDASLVDQHARFTRAYPGLPDFEVWVAPTLLGFNARVNTLGGKLVLVLGPDRIAQLDDDLGVLFTHELFHLFHVGRAPRLQSPPLTMAIPLFLEGLAVRASIGLNPAAADRALMDPALTAKCADPEWVRALAARFPTTVELSDDTPGAREVYAEWFSARGKPDPKRPGYCLGLRAVERLEAETPIAEMAIWPADRVKAKVTEALTALASQ